MLPSTVTPSLPSSPSLHRPISADKKSILAVGAWVRQSNGEWKKAVIKGVQVPLGFTVTYLAEGSLNNSSNGDDSLILPSSVCAGDVVPMTSDHISVPHTSRVLQDLTSLVYVHEAAVLEVLRHKTKDRMSYIWVGYGTLISFNQWEGGRLFSMPVMGSLLANEVRSSGPVHGRGRSTSLFETPAPPSTSEATSQLSAFAEPHLFTLSRRLCQGLHSENQSVIMMGGSGTGKSFSTSMLLLYLLAGTGAESASSFAQSCHQSIIKCLHLLVMFTHAVTTQNPNSSRCSTVIDLQYSSTPGAADANYRLDGARISVIGLEESRVAVRGIGDSNFHSLHAVFEGVTEEESAWLSFDCGSTFRYVECEGVCKGHTDCSLIQGHRKTHKHRESVSTPTTTPAEIPKLSHRHYHDGYSHRERYMDLFVSLRAIGCNEEDINVIIQSLAAVLHFGNIVSCGDNSDKSTCRFYKRPESFSTASTFLLNNYHCQSAASLLGIELNDLIVAILDITLRSDIVSDPNELKNECWWISLSRRCDIIAARLYSGIVALVLEACNTMCASSTDSTRTITLVDGPGFETPKNASSGSLLMNYFAEKIGQRYCQWAQKQGYSAFVKFKASHLTERMNEMNGNSEESRRNNIDWEHLPFLQRPSLSLLESRDGILSLLKQELRGLSSADLIGRLHRACFIHPAFVRRLDVSVTAFDIVHSCGSVTYNMDDIVDWATGHVGGHSEYTNYGEGDGDEANRSPLAALVGQSRYRLVDHMIICAVDTCADLPSQTLIFSDLLHRVSSPSSLGAVTQSFVCCVRPNASVNVTPVDFVFVSDQLREMGVFSVLYVHSLINKAYETPEAILLKVEQDLKGLEEIESQTVDRKILDKLLQDVLSVLANQELLIEMGVTPVIVGDQLARCVRACAAIDAHHRATRIESLYRMHSTRRVMKDGDVTVTGENSSTYDYSISHLQQDPCRSVSRYAFITLIVHNAARRIQRLWRQKKAEREELKRHKKRLLKQQIGYSPDLYYTTGRGDSSLKSDGQSINGILSESRSTARRQRKAEIDRYVASVVKYTREEIPALPYRRQPEEAKEDAIFAALMVDSLITHNARRARNQCPSDSSSRGGNTTSLEKPRAVTQLEHNLSLMRAARRRHKYDTKYLHKYAGNAGSSSSDSSSSEVSATSSDDDDEDVGMGDGYRWAASDMRASPPDSDNEDEQMAADAIRSAGLSPYTLKK